MPYLSLRPVRWLGWLSVAGWKLYRDRLGTWYLVHPATRRVRPLMPSARRHPLPLRSRNRWENDDADLKTGLPGWRQGPGPSQGGSPNDER